MHASIKQKQSAFEKKVLAMENGFNNFPVPNADLSFGKEVLTPNEVVQRFQGYLTIIQNVETTREAHQAAEKACEKAIPAANAFYEEAVIVVKAHFGSDPKILATFGLGSSRKQLKATPMVVIEEVIMPPEGDANARRAFASHRPEAPEATAAAEEVIMPPEGDANARRAFASHRPEASEAAAAVEEVITDELEIDDQAELVVERPSTEHHRPARGDRRRQKGGKPSRLGGAKGGASRAESRGKRGRAPSGVER